MISVWYFTIFSISLLKFSLCSYIFLLILVSIFISVILNSLSAESYNSVSLGSASGDLLCSFLWNIFGFLGSFLEYHFPWLSVCVGFCTWHKASIAASLHRLALYRRRPPPISQVRDSGDFCQLSTTREKQAAAVFVYSLCAEYVWGGKLWHLSVQTAISFLPRWFHCQTHQSSKTRTKMPIVWTAPGKLWY